MSNRQEISDKTDFDNGAEFNSCSDVFDYFTPAAQWWIFGVDAEVNEGKLRTWAIDVIRHRWHCSPSFDVDVKKTFAEVDGFAYEVDLTASPD